MISIITNLIRINQMGDDGTHMTMNNDNQFLDLLLSSVIFGTLLILLLAVIVLIYLYKKQNIIPILTKHSKDKGPNSVSEKQNSDLFSSEFDFPDRDVSTFGNTTSPSIDEQYFQRKQIIQKLSQYPDGIIQSRIPSLTNLSKATVSRRLNELFSDDIIEKIPTGRSNLILLKNN